MIDGIDTASPQIYLDFMAPWNDGHRVCYVKLGGDNVIRYVAPRYIDQVDKARAIGYRIGHYWVPDTAQDPYGAAEYYVSKLRNWNKASDFVVLDNESFKGNDPDGNGPRVDSVRYTDQQVAAWCFRVKELLKIPGNQIIVYSGLNDARGTDWTNTLAQGVNFLIAAYSYGPFEFALPNIPADRVVGHQTGGKVYNTIPGAPTKTVAVDVNKFKDTAFNYSASVPTPPTGDEMTPEQDNMLRQLYNAMFYGGESMSDDGKSVEQSLADLADGIASAGGGSGTSGLSEADLAKITAIFAAELRRATYKAI